MSAIRFLIICSENEWIIPTEQNKSHKKQTSISQYNYSINFINPNSIQQCYIKENLNHVDKIQIYQLNMTNWLTRSV